MGLDAQGNRVFTIPERGSAGYRRNGARSVGGGGAGGAGGGGGGRTTTDRSGTIVTTITTDGGTTTTTTTVGGATSSATATATDVRVPRYTAEPYSLRPRPSPSREGGGGRGGRLPPRRVLQVSPSGAPEAGGIEVLVIGERFDDFGDVKCRFGTAVVGARYFHRNALTCVAPPALALCHYDLPAGAYARPHDYGRVAREYGHDAPADCWGTRLPAQAALEVSLNGVDYTSGGGVVFTWYNRSALAASLQSIRPHAGFARGGTLVTVSGAPGWVHWADYGGGVLGARCQFGAALGSPVTPATIRSPSELSCHSPPRPEHAPAAQQVPS